MGVGGVLTKRRKVNTSEAKLKTKLEKSGSGERNSVYSVMGLLLLVLGGGGAPPCLG